MSLPPSPVEGGSSGPARIDADLLVRAVQEFTTASQEQAMAMVRPDAKRGDPLAAAVLCWFIHQRGGDGWREAVPHLRTAVLAGYPQVAAYFIHPMLGEPALRDEAMELSAFAAAQGVMVFDPLNHALSLAQQGDDAAAAAFFRGPWPQPLPTVPEGWTALVSGAREHSRTILRAATDVEESRDKLLQDWDATRARIEAQSKRLVSFMTETTSRQAYEVFDSEARDSGREARATWRAGVAIVAVAALISLMPLLLHYIYLSFGTGPEFTELQIVGIHATGALALGTLAGVMLTRARSRDRNRQRHTDLSVALKMMFAYAEQFDDAGERQAYITANGRVVLEAYLRQESPGDDAGPGLVPGA